jgi:predicted dehydrogenase
VRILVGNEWRGGYLDEHRASGSVRARVLAIANCAPLRDLYYVRAPSVARALGHLREVGPLWLGRKIASRLSESGRNEKFVSIGVGEVVEADDAELRAGLPIVFVAPCQPRAAERLVLARELVAPWDGALPSGLGRGTLALTETHALGAALRTIAGWNPFSGAPLDLERVRAAQNLARTALRDVDWSRALHYSVEPEEPVLEQTGEARKSSLPSAALFGFGHYARTIVLNGVHGSLDVRAVHEIDPALIPPWRNKHMRWLTSPELVPGERHDAYLIASYHHTHAPLAVHALEQGAAAVVEKPLATDRAQLHALLAALRKTDGRFFAGFHKRYSPLNELAAIDCAPPEPIHYHCIVFEEPLPARHWYRWANSRSRIVSNGCHWLDHFLCLNDWSEPREIEVANCDVGRETMNVSVRLENGAFFSMALSDVGSSRIGVRDYIELRCGDVSVKIENGSEYTAENGTRVVRRESVNKMASYERMYREIAARIASGAPGDSIESIERSTRLVLDVEEALLAEGKSAALA